MGRRPGLLVAMFGLSIALPAFGQEMEPRAYSPSPLGTNFVAVAVAYSDGDVLLDPTVPITNVHADVSTATLAYGRAFGLAGRQGLVSLAVPYAIAHAEGDVNETSQRVRRSGPADVRLRASWNLIGSPAVTPAEFAKAPRRTIFGASLTVQADTGQYDPTKLINLGTHRWAFKPEVGVSVPFRGWSFEAAAGAWLFTNNDSYYPGSSTKRQDPLTSIQAHIAYTFKSRAWLAVNGTWYRGGEVTIDGGPASERLSNSRAGATFSLPVASRNSLKFAASRGASARAGSDFTTFMVAWQLTWFDRSR